MSIILTPPAENFLMHLIYKSALFITLEVHIGSNKNAFRVKKGWILIKIFRSTFFAKSGSKFCWYLFAINFESVFWEEISVGNSVDFEPLSIAVETSREFVVGSINVFVA